MKRFCFGALCLLSFLTLGPALQAESPAPAVAAPAEVELDSFLATLVPEAPAADTPFLAASCTQIECVSKCNCGPAPCVSVCHSTAACLCHCEVLNPRRRC